LCFSFSLARGLNAKDIHKEIFPVYGGKSLLRKAERRNFLKEEEGETK
jgi:hypothetical protein